MFEPLSTLQIPTPYPQVNSPIRRIDYYMTPRGYLEGDIVQLAVKIIYENEEKWGKIIPISFSSLKKLIAEAEYTSTGSIGTETKAC